MADIYISIRKILIIPAIYAVYITNLSSQDTFHQTNFSRHDIKVGESLFFGLVKTDKEPVNCASCHNVFAIDTFNWNPSAYEIAVSTADTSFDDFKTILLGPDSKKLTEAHKDIILSDEQINQIRAFLGEIKKAGYVKEKPVITKLFLFIVLSIILLATLTDLVITQKIKRKSIHFLTLTIASGIILYILVIDAIALGRQKFYEPVQPIKFSHKVHAGDNKIDCKYCHHSAEQSKSAGIPAMDLCLNCHTIIREGTNSGRFEIKKVIAANEKGMPVEWVRIHNLPDHVFFSHAQHVAVGKLDCTECHGPVDQMDRIYGYSDLSMGWCLDCHRSHKVQFTENKYYDIYRKFHDDIKSGKIDSVLVKDVGGQDCQKCHY